jgi:hypothetical protein
MAIIQATMLTELARGAQFGLKISRNQIVILIWTRPIFTVQNWSRLLGTVLWDSHITGLQGGRSNEAKKN